MEGNNSIRFLQIQIEDGRPSDYNRVINYSSEGVEDTDGWYIHLQIQPLHADGGAYSGTGDEVIDVFYGESYGSVATPDNIAFGLYELEGENAEITEIKLRNLHNGKDTVITDPADIQSIAEFFTKVQGANRTSSKGYYGGSYEVQLCNGSRTVLSIGFGDDDSFNCGDYGDGYPARYELWGVTREDVIRFLSQFDSSDFDWGLAEEMEFSVNFAGNTSLQQEFVLTEDRPYWCILVENHSTEKISTEIGGEVRKIEPGTFDKIYSDEKGKPGTYSVSFATSGSSGMTGNAVCYTYKYRIEITGRLHNAAKDTTYVLLTNLEGITFEQAWKASGLSSNMDDYFDPADAVFIGIR